MARVRKTPAAVVSARKNGFNVVEQTMYAKETKTPCKDLAKKFGYVPNDVARIIYRRAMELRNEAKKEEAAYHAAAVIAQNIGRVCSGGGATFRIETPELRHKKGCSVNVKNEGRETKIATIVFDSSEVIRVYIGIKDGEYAAKFVTTRDFSDGFVQLVASKLAFAFAELHVLVNARRPSTAWLLMQLMTKTISEVSAMTGISTYRLNRMIT